MYSDSHVHLDFDEFEGALPELIQQCERRGVGRFVVPGVQGVDWQQQLEVCAQYSQLVAALGVHPWYLNNFQQADLELLRQLLQSHPEVIAVGEIGLDWKIDIEPEIQLEVFRQQLLIAQAYDKPVIIHHRKSHDQIYAQLRKLKFENGGVIHAFSGSLQQANRYIDLGFKLGIGGGITYPRAKKLQQIVKQLPVTSILLETDAPAMPLFGQQGKPNSPINIPVIFDCIAALREEPEELLQQQLERNFSQLFGDC